MSVIGSVFQPVQGCSLCMCLGKFLYMCISVCIYVAVYACMYVCMCVCVCLFVCAALVVNIVC